MKCWNRKKNTDITSSSSTPQRDAPVNRIAHTYFPLNEPSWNPTDCRLWKGWEGSALPDDIIKQVLDARKLLSDATRTAESWHIDHVRKGKMYHRSHN